MERIPPPRGVELPCEVLVDFAHTDDAIGNLLLSLRELRPHRILIVFGCGGDRDPSKRPLMGAVAARHADVVIVTSDNPRSEDPTEIAEQVLLGTRSQPDCDVRVEPDRRTALALALELAGEGDVVVAAGRGHQSVMEVEGADFQHDDRRVLRELMTERSEGNAG
jgi:UDP-N-acetylmuramoyl-L-alanyl-D-glutamate--2,6-diaminopimelate ligase